MQEQMFDKFKNVDVLEHRVLTSNNGVIWTKYIKIIERIATDNYKSKIVEQEIYRSEFQYFPHTQNNFIVWITAHTFHMLLTERERIKVENTLISYLNISQHRRENN